MTDEWGIGGYTPGLNVRLDLWAMRRGGRLRIGIERNGSGRGVVTASIGGRTGRGRTSSEALNELADLVVADGWPDDRRRVAA